MIWFALCAHATEMDVHGFVPAAFEPDPRDHLSVRRAGRIRGRSGYIGALVDYANKPLVARASNGEQFDLIGHLATANVVGGFSPVDRLRIDMHVPVYGFFGEDLDRVATNGFGLGDSRVSAMVSLIAPPADKDVGFGFALVPHLDLPTGQFDDYLGRRRIAGGGVASATLEAGFFTLSAEGGVQLETKNESRNLSNSDAIRFGGGMGFLVDPNVGLGVEVAGQYALDGQEGSTETPAEVLAHLRYAGEDGGAFSIGGAMGVSQGAGASAFRVFLGGAFGSTAAPRDRDRDGIADRDDACPTEPETMNKLADDDGCPDTYPRLSVGVQLDGTAVAGAEVELDGPESHAFQAKVLPQTFDVIPGSRWSASARLGACLEGEAQIDVADTDAKLVIDLVRKTVGQVKIVVFDNQGNLLSGVVASLDSRALGCVPRSPVETTGEGALFIDVGQGIHTLTLKSSTTVTQREFTVAPGKTAEVILVMTP